MGVFLKEIICSRKNTFLKLYGYTSTYLYIFTMGNTFSDFLIAFLDAVTLPKGVSSELEEYDLKGSP